MSAPALAMLFPGQGSQYPQMGRDILRCRAGRALLTEAEEISGLRLTTLLTTADATALAHPAVAQLSVLVHSLALLDQLADEGLTPDVVAGHSLGEYTAMVAAGMLDRRTALALVETRGRMMAQAVARAPGTMGAVVGLSTERVHALCRDAPGLVVVANVNSPRQLVVSGTGVGVEAVLAAAREAGALRAKRLPVGGAYHSPLVADAGDVMAAAWDQVVLAEPTCTFISSTTGQVVTDSATEKSLMRHQVCAAVQWAHTMTTVRRAVGTNGAGAVAEIGPGRVLAGLAREQAPGLTQLTVRPGLATVWPAPEVLTLPARPMLVGAEPR